MNWTRFLFVASFAAAGAAAQPAPAGSPPPTPQQRVAMLKQWLDASQAQLRGYEWIETTTVTKGGEEKSHKQNTVYYGADGKLQKVPLAGATEASAPRGPIRGRIAANKKEELTDYMQSAAELIHSYIPPTPDRIQQAVNAGKLSVNMTQPGRQVRLEFKDYLKTGDLLGIDVELPTNRLLGMNVSSYLDTPKDAVQMNVTMSVLSDGTIYTEKSVLDAPAKGIAVTVENSGYRRKGG